MPADAQYVTSLPWVGMDIGQSIFVLGVNHVQSGLASYVNVGLTDPLQQLGLMAFDNTEMEGSAAYLLEGTQYEWASKYMYAVQFARDCQGGACMSHFTGLSICTSGPSPACCQAVDDWRVEGCSCGIGGPLIAERAVSALFEGMAQSCKLEALPTTC
eukprot:gene29759-4971_t